MNVLCLRSPSRIASDAGVMCSATHCGLRSRRSNDEINACRVAMSATGPGKPYSKRPDGSTGKRFTAAGAEVDRPVCAVCWFGGVNICLAGIGIGADPPAVGEVENVVVVVDIVLLSGLRSDRNEYMVAVIAAPAPALAAAITANVVFDIVGKRRVSL